MGDPRSCFSAGPSTVAQPLPRLSEVPQWLLKSFEREAAARARYAKRRLAIQQEVAALEVAALASREQPGLAEPDQQPQVGRC